MRRLAVDRTNRERARHKIQDHYRCATRLWSKEVLHGRLAEQAIIDALLRRVRGGRSGALVILGEPGIGKTVLLDYAAAHSDGMRVLRGTGVESEAELAFASLHLLLSPVLDHL